MNPLKFIDQIKEMYNDQDPRPMALGPRNMEPRIGLAGGGFLWKLLYKGKPGLQVGRIEKDLLKKYRAEGMELGSAIGKANDEAFRIVDDRKLKIVEDAMTKVDMGSDDYIRLMDEQIRLTDYELYKDIKRWENTRPDLADKSRALVHPEWAEARFGEDYHGVLQKRQARALKAQSDEIDRMYPDKSDTDILVDEIDEMNKANIAEVIEGKKKHAIGGRVGYNDGQLVTPSVDGARPGYRGDKTQEVLKAYKEYKKSYHSSRHKYPIIPFTKFFEMYAKENFADGGSAGQLVTPSVDGSRPGYDGRKNRKVSYDAENKIIREYNKYLTDEIKSGNLSKSLGFKSWLRENKEPAVFEKTYNAHSKNLLNVKPAKLTDAKVGLVKTLVDSANAQGKFVEKKQILKLIGRDTSPGVAQKNVYVENIIKEINKLDSQEIKAHKAFNKLINNELVFVTDPDFYTKFPSEKLAEPGSINRMIIQETGLTSATLRKYRKTFKKSGSSVPYFNTKKGKQQLDIIKHMTVKMGHVGEKTFDGFSFNDLMEYGANSKKGKMYFKTATGSDFYKDANNVVRDFAVKNFDNNAKWGNDSKIKFYKKIVF